MRLFVHVLAGNDVVFFPRYPRPLRVFRCVRNIVLSLSAASHVACDRNMCTRNTVGETFSALRTEFLLLSESLVVAVQIVALQVVLVVKVLVVMAVVFVVPG